MNASAALEQRARRVAQRAGFIARKSRAGAGINNHGGFMLVDANTNACVAGSRFELTAANVIEECGQPER